MPDQPPRQRRLLPPVSPAFHWRLGYLAPSWCTKRPAVLQCGSGPNVPLSYARVGGHRCFVLGKAGVGRAKHAATPGRHPAMRAVAPKEHAEATCGYDL